MRLSSQICIHGLRKHKTFILTFEVHNAAFDGRIFYSVMGDEQKEDAVLVCQILSGDENAFAALYERYKPRLHRFVTNKLGGAGDWRDAEELVNDTFLRARAHLETLNEPEKVLNWMFRIANQLVAGWHRDNQRRIRMQSLAGVSVTEMEVAEAIVHQTEEEHALAEERRAAVFEAIAQFPELTRKMLQLQLAGKRYEEIAQILGVSVSSVRNRLSRAKKKLNAWGTAWEEANAEGRDVDFSEFNEGEGK